MDGHGSPLVLLPAGVVRGDDVGAAVQQGGARLGVTVFGSAQQRREAVLKKVEREQTANTSEEEEEGATACVSHRRLTGGREPRQQV